MKKMWIGVVLTINACCGCRQLGPDYPMVRALTRNTVDNLFLIDAKGCSLAARDLAELASMSSEDEGVKGFARAVYGRSLVAGEKLQELSLGAVTLPAEAGVADKNKLSALWSLRGKNFENAWLLYHQEIVNRRIELYRNEVKNGQFKIFTDYASEQLSGLLSEQKRGDSILNNL